MLTIANQINKLSRKVLSEDGRSFKKTPPIEIINTYKMIKKMYPIASEYTYNYSKGMHIFGFGDYLFYIIKSDQPSVKLPPNSYNWNSIHEFAIKIGHKLEVKISQNSAINPHNILNVIKRETHMDEGLATELLPDYDPQVLKEEVLSYRKTLNDALALIESLEDKVAYFENIVKSMNSLLDKTHSIINDFSAALNKVESIPLIEIYYNESLLPNKRLLRHYIKLMMDKLG